MMNFAEAKRQLYHWAKKLEKSEIVSSGAARLSVRVGENVMLITGEHFNSSSGSMTGILPFAIYDFSDATLARPFREFAIHAAIYQRYKEINVLIYTSKPVNLFTASKKNMRVPPLLEDFTQIVGPSVRTISIGDSIREEDARAVAAGMRGRNAVLVQDRGAFCGAHDFDDAYAVLLVLEKNCKAWIESTFLGGGKQINVWQAYLMRYFYKWKYSRIKKPTSRSF